MYTAYTVEQHTTWMSFIHRLKLTEYKESESLRLGLQQKDPLSDTTQSRVSQHLSVCVLLNPFNLNAMITVGASAPIHSKASLERCCMHESTVKWQRKAVCVSMWYDSLSLAAHDTWANDTKPVRNTSGSHFSTPTQINKKLYCAIFLDHFYFLY